MRGGKLVVRGAMTITAVRAAKITGVCQVKDSQKRFPLDRFWVQDMIKIVGK